MTNYQIERYIKITECLIDEAEENLRKNTNPINRPRLVRKLEELQLEAQERYEVILGMFGVAPRGIL